MLVDDLRENSQGFEYWKGTGDALVKTGAGYVHTVTITPTDVAATAGTITLYDKTTEATPAIFSVYIPAALITPITLTLDVAFTTGLYAGFDTTADVNVTISYI